MALADYSQTDSAWRGIFKATVAVLVAESVWWITYLVLMAVLPVRYVSAVNLANSLIVMVILLVGISLARKTRDRFPRHKSTWKIKLIQIALTGMVAIIALHAIDLSVQLVAAWRYPTWLAASIGVAYTVFVSGGVIMAIPAIRDVASVAFGEPPHMPWMVALGIAVGGFIVANAVSLAETFGLTERLAGEVFVVLVHAVGVTRVICGIVIRAAFIALSVIAYRRIAA